MEKKEAIKILKDFHDKSALFSVRTALETLYPEFKESRNEKIRKRLIEFFKDWGKTRSHCWSIYIPDILAWLEKQGESYTKKDVDDAWLKGMCDAKNELEKQGDSLIKWNKNTKDNKPQVNHSVLMKTIYGIAEGEWQGEQWLQYRWSGLVRDIDVLSWIELSDLEKQGEQRPFDYENTNIQQKDWAEIPFGTKDSELQEAIYIIPEGFHAEIRGDEVFIKKGEQKSSWTKEDEKMVDNILTPLAARYPFDIYQPMYNWLKALKQRIVGG